MKQQLLIISLLVLFVAAAPLPSEAQVFNTGPAGLARQMPRIYGPHIANSARVTYLQKQKRARRAAKSKVVKVRSTRPATRNRARG